MRPALTALLLACTLAGAVAARSAPTGTREGPIAVPPPLASRLQTPTALPIGGIVTGLLAVADCPEGVATVILPVFNTAIDPSVGIDGRDGARFLTFYAGLRLPETHFRVAVTTLHLVRAAGESFRIWTPAFETENMVRFAVPRDCPATTEAELGRIMAAVAAG